MKPDLNDTKLFCILFCHNYMPLPQNHENNMLSSWELDVQRSIAGLICGLISLHKKVLNVLINCL